MNNNCYIHYRGFKLSQKGFTLIEIMVVVIIIGILAAVVVPNIMGKPGEASVKKVKHDILTLEGALDMYKLDHHTYPTTDQGLDALVNKPTTSTDNQNWKKYIKRLPEDPWGHPYQYIFSGDDNIEIFSYGADGAIGGEGLNADIKNSDLK